MQLIVKHFDELTTRELYELLKVRSEIFVVEQNCIYQDMDDIDYRSLHVFYVDAGRVQACLRLFYRNEAQRIVQMGRVLTRNHGCGLGGRLLREGVRIARERMQARGIFLEAQTYAAGFYAREGFSICSGEFLEDGIPHVQMQLNFES